MQVPVCPGTTVGVPSVIFSCGPDVGVSEGRDIRFTWRLTCSSRHQQAAGLSFSYLSFSHVFKVTSLIGNSRLAPLSVLGIFIPKHVEETHPKAWPCSLTTSSVIIVFFSASTSSCCGEVCAASAPHTPTLVII